jgi:HK97 family phage portal protein
MAIFGFLRKKEDKMIRDNGNVQSTVCSTISPKIIISQDPVSIVSNNTGWVFACNNKIGTYMSSIPIHLYAKVPMSKQIEGKAIRYLKRVEKQIIKKESKVKDTYDIVEITEHDIINLLLNPYQGITWQDFIMINSAYLNLIGNSFVRIHREGNKIVGLEPLYSEYVRVNATNGKIDSYTYECPKINANVVLSLEEVLHLKSPSAGMILGGLGKAEAVQKSIALYNSFIDFEIKLSKNDAVPGLIVISKTTNGKQEDFNNAANKLRTQFGDLRKGSPLVLRGDVEVKQVSIPPKDLNFSEGRAWCLKEIASAFGIPIDLVNSEDSNRATSREAMNAFLNHTIIPDLVKILEQINTLIAKEYDQSLYVWYNKQEIIQENGQEEANKIKTYIDAGVITINEAREQLGLEPIEEVEVNNTDMENDNEA